MGGINENLVPKKDLHVKKKGKPETVRVHIDTQKGEVHFHDENISPRRTVEVPVSVGYRAWNDLQTLQRNEFEFLDPENGNILLITVGTTNGAKPEDPVEVNMEMDIVPAVVNDTFKALAKVFQRQQV